MNLKVYYQKIAEVEGRIAEEYPVVVSLETADGGRAGVLSETTPRVAAKMVVDGRVRLASDEEAKEFRERLAEERRIAEQKATASRMHITVLTESDLRAIKGSKPAK
ncbi:MAG: hypothetical protein IPM24_24680 [Bryobacterales bacterium]|nr:hypothetical protein [Bryobacterales bacterium]